MKIAVNDKVFRQEKDKLLVERQQNVIVLHSSVIEKEENRKLRTILEKYNSIHESDLERDESIDDDTKDLIRIRFREVFRVARKEWKAIKKQEYGDTNCTLCNQPNKLIFYIENIINGNKLNVGSTCIEYFKGVIKNEIFDEPIEKTRNRLRKEQNLVERRTAFTKTYPDCQKRIDELRRVAEESPLLLPETIYSLLTQYATDIFRFQTQFRAGKIPMQQLGELQPIIDMGLNTISNHVEPWLKANEGELLIITHEDKKWLESHNQETLIKTLRAGNSRLTMEAIVHLAYADFIKRHINIIKRSLPMLKSLSIGTNRITVRFKHSNIKGIAMFTTYRAFLSKFGYLILENEITKITSLDEYLSVFELLPSENNIYDFILTLDRLFTDYIFYYSDKTELITIVSKKRNAYREYNKASILYKYIYPYMISAERMKDAEQRLLGVLQWEPITEQYRTDYLNDLIKAKKDFD